MTIKFTLNWKIMRLCVLKFKVCKIKSINYYLSIDTLLQNASKASLDSLGSPNTQIWP